MASRSLFLARRHQGQKQVVVLQQLAVESNGGSSSARQSRSVSAARTYPSASPARRAKNGIPSSDGATQRSSKHGHPSPRSTGAASVGWRASVDGGDSGVEATAGDLAVATTELLIGIHPLCFRRSGRAVEVDGSPLPFGVLRWQALDGVGSFPAPPSLLPLFSPQHNANGSSRRQLWMWRPRTSDDGRRRSLPASDVQQQGLPQQPWPLAPSFSLGVTKGRSRSSYYSS
nr:hypothetical protein Iba_chr02aCG9570 [Ipomoea batatas]